MPELVATNSVWIPDGNPIQPIVTITTTGAGAGDHTWYQPNLIGTDGSPWRQEHLGVWPPAQPLVQPLTIPTINWFPPPTVPSPVEQHLIDCLKAVEKYQQAQTAPPKVEEPEEPAKPVEKKYGRVLEP